MNKPDFLSQGGSGGGATTPDLADSPPPIPEAESHEINPASQVPGGILPQVDPTAGIDIDTGRKSFKL